MTITRKLYIISKWLNNIEYNFVYRETGDETVESAEQDRTARMFRLILIYTICEVDPWSRTTE